MRTLLPILLSITLVFGTLTHIVLALPNSSTPKQSTTISLTKLITNKTKPTPTINKPKRISATNKLKTVPTTKGSKPVPTTKKPKLTKKPKSSKKPKPNATTITAQTQTMLPPPSLGTTTTTLIATGTVPSHIVIEPVATASPISREPSLFTVQPWPTSSGPPLVTVQSLPVQLPLPSPSPSVVVPLPPPPPPQPTPTLSNEEKEQNAQLQKDAICNSICRPNAAMRKVCGMTPGGTKFLADGCLMMRYNCLFPEDTFTLVDTADC